MQPTPAVAPLPTVPATLAPTYDLSPVAAPAGLVAFARISRPSKIPGVLSSWTGLPIPIDEALGEALGDGVSAIVDTAEPIDIAFAIEGASRRPTWAVSAGVRSIDDAKSALQASFYLSPLANGAFRIKPHRHDKRGCDDDDDGCDDGPRITRACVLAPAFGSAPARVVCGKSSVDAIWPYMVRGATRIDAPSDVHAEIYADAVRSMMGDDRSPIGWYARDVGRAGSFGADLVDFAGDVDKLVFDAKLDDAAASATATLSFKQVRSPLSRMAVAHADKVGPPPAAFAKLPADSDAAFFVSGIDAKEIERAKTVLGELLGKELDETGMPQADRKAFIDASKSLLGLAEAPIVWAKGSDVAGANAAVALARSAQGSATQSAAERAAAAKLGGWNILGVEQPLAKVAAVVKEWSAFASRPSLVKWNQSRDPSRPLPTLKSAPAPKGLPADTQHWELGIASIELHPPAPVAGPPPKSPPRKVTFIVQKVQLYLVPDGARTYVVWSLDDAMAIEKAKALAAGSGATLATKNGLGDLQSARANAGGFVSMRALALDGPLTVASRTPSESLERPDPLFGMQASNAGVAVVPFWFGAGQNQTMSMGVKVPREAVRDAMVLARALRF